MLFRSTATVYTVGMDCVPPSTITTAGSGYTITDVLTMVGGVCPVAMQIGLASVNGSGGITGYGGRGGGYCTSLPPDPISWSGGTGSGFTTTGIGWTPVNFSLTGAGGGYTAAPVGTLSPTSGVTYQTGTGTTTVLTTLSNTFTLTGGQGELYLSVNGTELGISGPTGFSVINKGALVDATTIFVASPTAGATSTMAANTDSLVLENGAVLATYTVKLPPITAVSGQLACIKSVGGVTSVTIQTSAAGSITGAPTSILAQTPVCLNSDGATWH